MKKIYLDLGANIGRTAEEFVLVNRDYDIFCVEPNIELLPKIFEVSQKVRKPFSVIWGAAWIENGSINLFQSGAHEASTVVTGKVENADWPQIDYQSGSQVPCFDLSEWILRNVDSYDDELVIKMDIEGAEYDVLEKMLQDGSIDRVTILKCEWHYDRYPGIPVDRHHAVRDAAKARTNLIDWQ